ncbi:hypothetical protein [Pseudochelatococcus contaminans]|uniref:Uncharacterized protein n=1 Tax=Pseudochelatococcus contaminans TaxID=1538103 RepID=A0A7W6EI52_9HYPH|nr:hypothetical protein [Pseudochelatococcus contaminans]MBB3810708.1 hypothetical protein [Pseudochelatococcus contaminans]
MSIDIKHAIWWGALSAIEQWKKSRHISDEALVEAARTKNLNGKLIHKFALEYQVFRFPLNLHDRRTERLQAIAEVLEINYSPKINDNDHTAELAQRWFKTIGDVHATLARYGAAANLRSFSMKALWLYQPEHATMWDSFAVRGLKSLADTKHPREIKSETAAAAFLHSFEDIFKRHEALINSAIKPAEEITGVRYKYPRRVLDKALWLLGNKGEEQRDAAFNRLTGLYPEATAEFLGTPPHA